MSDDKPTCVRCGDTGWVAGTSTAVGSGGAVAQMGYGHPCSCEAATRLEDEERGRAWCREWGLSPYIRGEERTSWYQKRASEEWADSTLPAQIFRRVVKLADLDRVMPGRADFATESAAYAAVGLAVREMEGEE